MSSHEKINILIVDDAPENIRILSELLKADYRIRVVTTGEKALQVIFSQEPPDLVLLDIVLPGISGYEVCETVKASPEGHHIPVIFITSKHDETDEVKGFEMGAVDYITKPFNPVIVKARVKTQADLKRYRDQLEHITYIDILTDLPNRRKFEMALDTAWNYALRNQYPLSLLMIDVDHFKKYNDLYGHIAGDQCLKAIATALKSHLKRKVDVLCRYGGEEFVCVLPNTNEKSALILAQRLTDEVASLQLRHEASDLGFVTISIGVAMTIPSKEGSPLSLLDHADQALYKSKALGRNRVTY